MISCWELLLYDLLSSSAVGSCNLIQQIPPSHLCGLLFSTWNGPHFTSFPYLHQIPSSSSHLLLNISHIQHPGVSPLLQITSSHFKQVLRRSRASSCTVPWHTSMAWNKPQQNIYCSSSRTQQSKGKTLNFHLFLPQSFSKSFFNLFLLPSTGDRTKTRPSADFTSFMECFETKVLTSDTPIRFHRIQSLFSCKVL